MGHDGSNSQVTLRPPPASGLWAELSGLVARLRRDLCGGYHPERHYMRGPGPAWHARQAGRV